MLLDSTELACTGMGLDSVLVLSHNLEVTHISTRHKKVGWGQLMKEMSLGSYLVHIYSDVEFSLTL